MFVVLASAAFYHVGSAPVLVELGDGARTTANFCLSRTASAKPPNSENVRFAGLLVCYRPLVIAL